MPIRIKEKIQKGIQIEFGVLDDKRNHVGDFVTECTVCQSTYFEPGENYTVGICVNCGNVVARRTDVYPEPVVKVKGKKVIGFATETLGDFKWVCSACDNDMSFLMRDLATTTCTACGKVTSRNKAAVTTVSFKEAVTWNV
jgi:rRNA maturation endonuclease Nob1